MDRILQLLIAYFAKHSVAPPEVTPEDTDREKSYLVDLPESPDNVFMFREYSARHAKLVAKNVAVKRIQVIVRNQSQVAAFNNIEKLYFFLLQLSAEGEFFTELNTNHWMLLDCSRGPTKLSIDEKGRHLWSISFAVTTNLF